MFFKNIIKINLIKYLCEFDLRHQRKLLSLLSI